MKTSAHIDDEYAARDGNNLLRSCIEMDPRGRVITKSLPDPHRKIISARGKSSIWKLNDAANRSAMCAYTGNSTSFGV
jgi:hypothetical protein